MHIKNPVLHHLPTGVGQERLTNQNDQHSVLTEDTEWRLTHVDPCSFVFWLGSAKRGISRKSEGRREGDGLGYLLSLTHFLLGHVDWLPPYPQGHSFCEGPSIQLFFLSFGYYFHILL